MRWLDKLGASFLGLFSYLFTLLALFYLSIKVVWTNRNMGQRDFVKQVSLQIYYTGVQAAGSVFIIALGVGVLAVASGVGGFGALSGTDNLGRMVTIVILREVSPLLTAGIVIVRSVTAISSELGVMRVQREIEAIEVMGISPIRQLVTPRIFGGILSLFCLNVLFTSVALIGGFLIAQFFVSIPASIYFNSVLTAVTPMDIIGLTFKISLGGIGLFVIACYHGLDVNVSPTEVPVAVSKASLNAFVFVIAVNGIASFFMLMQIDTATIFMEMF